MPNASRLSAGLPVPEVRQLQPESESIPLPPLESLRGGGPESNVGRLPPSCDPVPESGVPASVGTVAQLMAARVLLRGAGAPAGPVVKSAVLSSVSTQPWPLR